MPPVIHHTEKQEFTITLPGHESAYLRYTRNTPNGWVLVDGLQLLIDIQLMGYIVDGFD